jgi:hypothetical protein
MGQINNFKHFLINLGINFLIIILIFSCSNSFRKNNDNIIENYDKLEVSLNVYEYFNRSHNNTLVHPLKFKSVKIKKLDLSKIDDETISKIKLKSIGNGIINEVEENTYKSIKLNYIGLFEIKQYTNFSENYNYNRILKKIDIPSINEILKPNNNFNYIEIYEQKISISEVNQVEYFTKCKTFDVVNAAVVHTHLIGLAIPFKCESMISGRKSSISEGYYLMNYGWFFNSYFSTSFYSGKYELINFEEID